MKIPVNLTYWDVTVVKQEINEFKKRHTISKKPAWGIIVGGDSKAGRMDPIQLARQIDTITQALTPAIDEGSSAPSVMRNFRSVAASGSNFMLAKSLLETMKLVIEQTGSKTQSRLKRELRYRATCPRDPYALLFNRPWEQVLKAVHEQKVTMLTPTTCPNNRNGAYKIYRQ